MSPERVALRQAIDAAKRARIEAENATLKLCGGCGMPYADWTPGCRLCWDRHRRHDPPLALRVRIRDFTERLSTDALRTANLAGPRGSTA